MKNLVFAFILMCLLSCEKEVYPIPTANFTYKINGEGNITFNISTANADSFVWDFGDGGTTTERIPTYTYEKNGLYTVTLKVKGKGGEIIVNKTIEVNDITGSVIFWMQTTRNKEIEVYVDKKYAGKITGYYSSGISPTCGGQYCATLSGLSEGSHKFEASETFSIIPTKWSSTVSVTGRKCSNIKLQY